MADRMPGPLRPPVVLVGARGEGGGVVACWRLEPSHSLPVARRRTSSCDCHAIMVGSVGFALNRARDRFRLHDRTTREMALHTLGLEIALHWPGKAGLPGGLRVALAGADGASRGSIHERLARWIYLWTAGPAIDTGGGAGVGAASNTGGGAGLVVAASNTGGRAGFVGAYPFF